MDLEYRNIQYEESSFMHMVTTIRIYLPLLQVPISRACYQDSLRLTWRCSFNFTVYMPNVIDIYYKQLIILKYRFPFLCLNPFPISLSPLSSVYLHYWWVDGVSVTNWLLIYCLHDRVECFITITLRKWFNICNWLQYFWHTSATRVLMESQVANIMLGITGRSNVFDLAKNEDTCSWFCNPLPDNSNTYICYSCAYCFCNHVLDITNVYGNSCFCKFHKDNINVLSDKQST